MSNPHIAVIGAGAFGGWTAWHLLQQGAKVTLLDAWGAGNSRASSGGETRVIRCTYGPDGIYTEMTARAYQLWEAFEQRFDVKCLTRTGSLWMDSSKDDSYMESSLPHLKKAGIQVEQLSPKELANRWPQINTTDIKNAFFEHGAGYLYARQSCETLARIFSQQGGNYLPVAVKPTRIKNSQLQGVTLSSGELLEADQYVFACGPWLLPLFPKILKDSLRVSRQEMYFFTPPAGNKAFHQDHFPVWLDFSKEGLYYGIPGNNLRGFKIADDSRGPAFNPDTEDRVPSQSGIEQARAFLAYRFPALANAPLQESRICQYTNSPDGHFIIDRHPEATNVWIAGGGTGHGYKMGPATGEHLAGCVLGKNSLNPIFSIDRSVMEGSTFSQFKQPN